MMTTTLRGKRAEATVVVECRHVYREAGEGARYKTSRLHSRGGRDSRGDARASPPG